MFDHYRRTFIQWLDRVSNVQPPPCYAYYDGMKVYGATEAERQRVLGYLRGELPEVNMEYIIEHEKIYPPTKGAEDKVRLSEEHIDHAFRFIRFLMRD